MAETKYSFEKFTNLDQLTTEIGSSSITTSLSYINGSETTTDVFFVDVLSGGDETTLNSIITNHTPQYANETVVNDSDVSATSTDSYIAYVDLSVSRSVALPLANSVPAGRELIVADASGSCSLSKTITINSSGTNTIQGVTSVVIASPYGMRRFFSNGNNQWTFDGGVVRTSTLTAKGSLFVASAPNTVIQLPIGTDAHVLTADAVSTGGMKWAIAPSGQISSSTPTDLTGYLYGNGSIISPITKLSLTTDVSGVLPIANGGTNGSTVNTARNNLYIDGRTAVSDVDATAISTNVYVAYTSISAARQVTLPLANSVNAGYKLTIGDESGSCSLTNTITLVRAGADTIQGTTSAVIASPYGMRRLFSDGISKWIFDGGVPRTSTLTAKGDIYVASAANVVTRLGVSTNGLLLGAASGQTTGLNWIARHQTHTFFDNSTGLVFIQTNQAAFTTVARLTFRGTTALGSSVSAMSTIFFQEDTSKTADIQIYDVTNAQAVTSMITITGAGTDVSTIRSFTVTTANLSSGAAIWEVQMRCTGGKRARSSDLTITY